MSRAGGIRLELDLVSEAELRTLRGALLAARASELSELHRRAGRLSYGYGSESARTSMDAETRSHRDRIDVLDRLLAALAAALPASEPNSGR